MKCDAQRNEKSKNPLAQTVHIFCDIFRQSSKNGCSFNQTKNEKGRISFAFDTWNVFFHNPPLPTAMSTGVDTWFSENVRLRGPCLRMFACRHLPNVLKMHAWAPQSISSVDRCVFRCDHHGGFKFEGVLTSVAITTKPINRERVPEPRNKMIIPWGPNHHVNLGVDFT